MRRNDVNPGTFRSYPPPHDIGLPACSKMQIAKQNLIDGIRHPQYTCTSILQLCCGPCDSTRSARNAMLRLSHCRLSALTTACALTFFLPLLPSILGMLPHKLERAFIANLRKHEFLYKAYLWGAW